MKISYTLLSILWVLTSKENSIDASFVTDDNAKEQNATNSFDSAKKAINTNNGRSSTTSDAILLFKISDNGDQTMHSTNTTAHPSNSTCHNSTSSLLASTPNNAARMAKAPLTVSNATRQLKGRFGSNGLCVIGCTPYVDWYDDQSGKLKYLALIEDMATDCDIIVHVGDTKAGGEKCDSLSLTRAVHALKDAGASKGKLVLYAPGDNELNDCHRLASKRNNPNPEYLYKAMDSRKALVENLPLGNTDLTEMYQVERHLLNGTIQGTNEKYSCDFDKYYETESYAVATLEVIGSHWYLDDERRNGYPYQDDIDPLEGRLAMYINAKDCALDWITKSANKADANGLRAVFFMLHATFYSLSGTRPYDNSKVGKYFGGNKLLDRIGIKDPYQPLFDKFQEVAFNHPNLMFYIVHSDGHRSINMRMFPDKSNFVSGGKLMTRGHQNIFVHQIEGASRGLTMYSKFTVDPKRFQPVTLKEEWSEAAYNIFPLGHSYDPY